jgi:hypothetical protein
MGWGMMCWIRWIHICYTLCFDLDLREVEADFVDLDLRDVEVDLVDFVDLDFLDSGVGPIEVSMGSVFLAASALFS